MLSKLIKYRQTHAAHHHIKNLSGASHPQLVLLGLAQPTKVMGIQSGMRLFSGK